MGKQKNLEELHENMVASILMIYENCGWESAKESMMKAYTETEIMVNNCVPKRNKEELFISKIQNTMRVLEILINMKLNDVILPEDRLKHKALVNIFLEKLGDVINGE